MKNSIKIHWSSYDCNNFDLSILEYIDKNELKIRNDYLKFIENIGEQKIYNIKISDYFQLNENLNIWEVSLICEKNFYKSSYISEALKLFALKDILILKHIKKVIIYDINRDSIKSIKYLCKKLNVIVSIKKSLTKKFQKKSNKEIIKFFIPYFFRALYTLLNHFIALYKISSQKINFEYQNKDNILFISYFANFDKRKIKKGLFVSDYWSFFPNYFINKGFKINWIHHILPHINKKDSLDLLNFVNKFSKINGNHYFFENFFSLIQLLKVFWTFIFLNCKYYLLIFINKEKIFINSEINLWPLIYKDFYTSIIGPHAIKNIIFYSIFNRFLKLIETQKIGFLLYENQSWEKIFINLWNKYNHGKLIAVINSPVRFWDLKLFSSINLLESKKNYIYKIAVNSASSFDNLINGGYNKNDLVKVEALRYLKFSKYIKPSFKKFTPSYSYSKDNKLRIIILGGFSISPTNEILSFLNKFKFVNDKVQISYKPHPGINQKESKQYNFVIIDDNEDIIDLSKKFDLAIVAGDSSVAIDAYILGMKVIIFINEDINVSPLKDLKGVKFAKNNDDLNFIFSNLTTKSFELESNFNEFFWIDDNISLWKNFLEFDLLKK